MSVIDLSTPIQSPPSIEVRITPEEILASVQEARSGRALSALQRRYIDLGMIDIPTEEAIKQRRKEVRRRDGNRCTLCGCADRVEVHHIRKHKGNKEHDLAKMIALCASCHRKARNPRSETSRMITRNYLGTEEPDEAKVSRPVREGA